MKKESKYIIYEYDIKEEDLINKIDSYINDNALKVFEFFDLEFNHEKATVKIWNTKEEFDLMVKKFRNSDNEIPKWMVGLADNDGHINCVSLDDYKNTSQARILENYSYALDYYIKGILHEYVHYVNSLFCKKHNYPYPVKCLLEGIAQVLSNQKENFNKEFNYSLEDILNSNNCYDGWFLVVRYILNNYSKEYFLSLFKDNEYSNNEIKKIFKEIK